MECESKSDTNNNNRGNWNHLKIIQTVPEQHTGRARNQGTTKNSHTEHCTHTSESTKYTTYLTLHLSQIVNTEQLQH